MLMIKCQPLHKCHGTLVGEDRSFVTYSGSICSIDEADLDWVGPQASNVVVTNLMRNCPRYRLSSRNLESSHLIINFLCGHSEQVPTLLSNRITNVIQRRGRISPEAFSSNLPVPYFLRPNLLGD